MLGWLRLLPGVLILIFLSVSVSAPTDKPKPKLLDGELIEDGQPSPPPPVLATPEIHTSQTVTLLKEFTVTLEANPTTGFSWRVASHDRNYLQLLRHRFEKPNPPRPGAPGRQCFDFLPLKSGTTTITFHYQRPYERQAIRELRHTIIIR